MGERVSERSRLVHLLGPGDEVHGLHLRHLLLLLHLHARVVRVAALQLSCRLRAPQLLLRVEDGGGHLLHFRLECLLVCGVLRIRALPLMPLLRRRGRRALRASLARLLLRVRDWRHWRVALLDRGLGLLAFCRVAIPIERRELVARLPVGFVSCARLLICCSGSSRSPAGHAFSCLRLAAFAACPLLYRRVSSALWAASCRGK